MTNTTLEQLKAKDCVELLKPQYSVGRKNEKEKIADPGVYTVVSVVGDQVKLRSGRQSFWAALEDVQLKERYISPEEIITPVQGHVLGQFNGKPKGLWELVDFFQQPAPIIRGALNKLVERGLLEEIELEVWRKVDDRTEQGNQSENQREEREDSGDNKQRTRHILAESGKRDASGCERFEEEPFETTGDRGADTLSRKSVVSGQKERPRWAVEAEEELNHLQGQIDNCSIEKAATKDSALKKSLFTAYKENQRAFREAVERYTNLAADIGYSFGIQTEKIDERYNRIVVYVQSVEVCGLENCPECNHKTKSPDLGCGNCGWNMPMVPAPNVSFWKIGDRFRKLDLDYVCVFEVVDQKEGQLKIDFANESESKWHTQDNLKGWVDSLQRLPSRTTQARVVEPQSRLGEILNLSASNDAKVVSPPTLKEQEAEANQLWEQRSQLEGQLLHCIAKIYLGGEWKKEFKTWTQYFIATFSNWQKTHRYRMKDAGEIFSQFLLSPQGDSETRILPLPTSEGQLRELKSLPAPERVPTWQQIVEEHGESPPRTVVAEVVKKVKTELQQPAQLQAQVKTEEEIAAQFNCIVGDPVRVTYTGRARGLESDVAPQYDGLIGVVRHLGVASGLVFIPILDVTIRCTPSQMVAVPTPSDTRNICDRITALVKSSELSPMVRGALEALSRQVEYSEDDMWLLGQIEERLNPSIR